MKKEVLDRLAYYDLTEEDVMEIVPYSDIVKAGYGTPSDKGVHALHFPHDPGNYYIIKCKPDNCPICEWSN